MNVYRLVQQTIHPLEQRCFNLLNIQQHLYKILKFVDSVPQEVILEMAVEQNKYGLYPWPCKQYLLSQIMLRVMVQ